MTAKEEIKSIALYRRESGEIVMIGRGSAVYREGLKAANDLLFIESDEQIPVSAHSEKWVVDGEIVDRPDMPTILDGDMLHDVPLGAEVYINGALYVAEESSILLELDPGVHQIRVWLWPFRALEFSYANH